MGLLRKRTSKASLKAKESEPRIPTPPPQLPPLPAHIRRSESTSGSANPDIQKVKSPAGSISTSSMAGRRRSRSLWGTSDARVSGFDRSSGRRRDSFGSNMTSGTTPDVASQPWRSREAWLALHAPAAPSVLSELTFPCAPGATAPGWRGRGGGGFFGGEADEMEKERIRPSSRAADNETRNSAQKKEAKEPVPPLPTSPITYTKPVQNAPPQQNATSPVSSVKAVHNAPSRLPVAKANPTAAKRQPAPEASRRVAPPSPAKAAEPLPDRNRATTPTPELAKSPSRSPETTAESLDSIESDSAAAYAIAAGISSPTASDYTTDKRSPSPDYSRNLLGSAPSGPAASNASKMGNSPHMDPTPGLTSSPALSAASPNMPVTPRMARRVASNDNMSPGTPGVLLTPNSSAITSLADSRATPWGAASRSATPLLTRANSNSTLNSVSNSLSASISAAPTQTSQRGGGPQRLPPPSYTQSEDGHNRHRSDQVEHFIDHRSSLPESGSKNPSRAVSPVRPSPPGEFIDFTRPPPGEDRAAPHPMLAGNPSTKLTSTVVSGYPTNLSPNPPPSAANKTNLPARTPSTSSQTSSEYWNGQGSQNSSSRHPEPRRAPSRTERAPSCTERSRAPSRANGRNDREDRPPSRSSQGHGEVPYTPAAIANAVNAWRQKNGSKKTLDEGLLSGQHPSSRAHTPSMSQENSARSRTRSGPSSNGHGGSSHGHGRKSEKLEAAPESETNDVDEDPFAAAQHPWEAAYDVSDYHDEVFESAEESPEPEEHRGPIRLPHVSDMPAAGGELPPPIEPPVQTVPPASVLQAHVQMSAAMQKGAATAPRNAQHYYRPGQERPQPTISPEAQMAAEHERRQGARRPSDASYASQSQSGWTPLGFSATQQAPHSVPQQMSPPMGGQRILSPDQHSRSPPMGGQRVLSPDQLSRSPPPGSSAHFPAPPNGYPSCPRQPPQGYPSQPNGQQPFPGAGPPNPGHQGPPGYHGHPGQPGQSRPPPGQGRPYPAAAGPPGIPSGRQGPQRLPTHPGGFPSGPTGHPLGPPQHVYRPTQPRPYRPAAAPQQSYPYPQQHQQYSPPSQHAAQFPDQGYHAHQLSGGSSGHGYANGYEPAQYAPQQQHYGQPQRLPPHPQYAQSKPRAMPADSVNVSNVNMQLPQLHKSPKVPQSVAQGGWI